MTLSSRLVVAMLTATITLASSAFAPSSAYAQAGNAAADELFREAVSLAREKKYAEAVDKFAASHALDPARGTLHGWALAEERLGRLASALAHYRELIEQSKKARDADRERKAKKRVSALEPRVPRMTISVPDHRLGMQVKLDGAPLESGALETPLPVDPGQHEVSAQAGDGSRFAAQVSIAEGQSMRVDIQWTAPRALPPKEKHAEPLARPARTPDVQTRTPSDTSGMSTLRTAGLVTGAWVWWCSASVVTSTCAHAPM